MIEAFLMLAGLWLVAAMTPGPNFFAVVHVATGQGGRAALACAMGTVVGTAIWATAGFFGLKALFVALPAAAAGIKLAGAAYLIWVGIGLWRAAGRDGPGRVTGDPRRAFLFGLVTNLANPKTAAFAASLFAVALPPDASAGLSALAICLVCAISAIWYGMVALVISRPLLAAAYARARKPIMRVTGVLFAGYGGSLAFDALGREDIGRAEM